MDDDFTKTLRALTWAIIMALIIGVTILLCIRTYPHDWDCSKHEGMIPPPSSPYITDVQIPRTICVDGYRP